MNICRICGQSGIGIVFTDWVRPTFTDWDKLQGGKIICDACLFWFNERSENLAHRVGKEKPQRMRNYSHFIVNGEWTPLSKGNKKQMTTFLLSSPFPELAAIAESGQKHIAFRATRNPPSSKAGWIQFEEQSLWVDPPELKALLGNIEALYTDKGFSKGEIKTGNYAGYRVLRFGFQEWNRLESLIKSQRGSLLFRLALFLAQKGESREDERIAHDGSRFADDSVAGNSSRLQKQVPNVDLATVRGSSKVSRVYEQPGEICQLSLFESPGQPGNE